MKRVSLLCVLIVWACLPAPAAGAQSEVIAGILVHGNHTTPDEVVRQIANLAEGESATEARLQEAEHALRASGRFADVELRRRLRSIADPTQILVVIVVSEHPGVSPDGRRPATGARIRRAAMWLPVVGYDDGYGFTYGARVSFVEVLGGRSRLSVPLTWGGERRAAVEVERTFGGPITRIRGVAAAHSRLNPHFDLRDSRQDAGIEIERAWTPWLRTGASGGLARVGFGAVHTRHRAAGAHVTVDTRLDPSFPRNAVHARVGWERLSFSDQLEGAGRWLADLRGYVGVGGSRVLALRGQISRADAPLPFVEQPLLGGSGSLRGHPAGHRAGDSLAALSAELRWPLTSPLRAARFGIKGFLDAGTTWAAGARLREQRFERGVGGGVFAGIAMLSANLDVGWAEDRRARGHVAIGVSF